MRCLERPIGRRLHLVLHAQQDLEEPQRGGGLVGNADVRLSEAVMGLVEYRRLLPARCTLATQNPATGSKRSSRRKQSTSGTGPASIAPFAAATATALGTISYNAIPRRAISK